MNTLDSPLVSVCVATYNQDRYIEDCLTSVLAQATGAPIEILVGDDGSSPGTPKFVERLSMLHPGVIQYFRHERNLGPAENYQFLVRQARGTYVAHLDGDDFWLPGKLKAQLEWMEANPDSPACYTNAVVVDERGVLLGSFSTDVGCIVNFPFLLEKGNFLNHSSLLYRRDWRDVVLDAPPPFIDYRLHLGFARNGPLGFDRRSFVVYRFATEHSMVRTVPETVRTLYFEALCSALPDPSLEGYVRRSALTHFLMDIVFFDLLQLRLGQTRHWLGRVRSDFPQYYLPAALGAVWGAGRKLLRAQMRKLCRLLHIDGGLRVFHER